MVVFAVVLWPGPARRGPPGRIGPTRSLVGSSLAPPGRRAGAAPAGLARGLRLRLLQRVVDHHRLLALGLAVPLLQRGDRPLRAGRSGRGPGRQPGRQAGRRRPGHRLHRRGGRPPGRLVRRPVVRPLLVGRPARRHRRARHRDPGHADHQPGHHLRAAARRPEPDQQRLHGLLLHRWRRRVDRRRAPSTPPGAGPVSVCWVPASAC